MSYSQQDELASAGCLAGRVLSAQRQRACGAQPVMVEESGAPRRTALKLKRRDTSSVEQMQDKTACFFVCGLPDLCSVRVCIPAVVAHGPDLEASQQGILLLEVRVLVYHGWRMLQESWRDELLSVSRNAAFSWPCKNMDSAASYVKGAKG